MQFPGQASAGGCRERRQDFDDVSKEYVARHQKKIQHQDSRKQAIEY
jgi:hypothetical protein